MGVIHLQDVWMMRRFCCWAPVELVDPESRQPEKKRRRACQLLRANWAVQPLLTMAALQMQQSLGKRKPGQFALRRATQPTLIRRDNFIACWCAHVQEMAMIVVQQHMRIALAVLIANVENFATEVKVFALTKFQPIMPQ